MTKHHHSSMSGIPVRAKRARVVKKLRDAIGKAAEGLIELADVIDGDSDREPDADSEETGDKEPSLGSIDKTVDQKNWAAGSDDDEEKDNN